MSKNLSKKILRALYFEKDMDRTLSERAAAEGITKAVLIRKLIQDGLDKVIVKKENK